MMRSPGTGVGFMLSLVALALMLVLLQPASAYGNPRPSQHLPKLTCPVPGNCKPHIEVGGIKGYHGRYQRDVCLLFPEHCDFSCYGLCTIGHEITAHRVVGQRFCVTARAGTDIKFGIVSNCFKTKCHNIHCNRNCGYECIKGYCIAECQDACGYRVHVPKKPGGGGGGSSSSSGGGGWGGGGSSK